MKKNYKWVITYCLIVFISFFNYCIPVSAATTSDMTYGVGIEDNLDKLCDDYYNKYPNRFMAYAKFSSNSIYYYYCWSDKPINLTTLSDTTVSGWNVLGNTTGNFHYGILGVDLVDGTIKYTFTSNNYSNGNIGYSLGAKPIEVDYVSLGGSVTYGGNAVKDGSSIIPPKTIEKNDILNFNWGGDGIQIYNLNTGMNVSGYQDTSGLKYFDIETYGKFKYTGSDTFFTTIAYKKMQTSIQLASILTYGTESRRCGEGLGIKSFEWVSDTSHLKNGDIIKFRIVYQAPMLDKGSYNISIGTTINNGLEDKWISNTIKGINFLNENADTGNFDNTGETGNVGTVPGNIPQGSDTSVNGTLTSITTMFSSFSGFIGTMFNFLPTEVKVMFTGVCILIVGLMVKRAVL